MSTATPRPAPELNPFDRPPLASRPAAAESASIGKTGLRFLLAVVTSLFMLLIVAMLIRSQYADWESLTEPWQPLAHPWSLWVNSALLLLASVALQWARSAARRQDQAAMVNRLALGGVLSCGFVAGQLWVWQLLHGQGFGVAGNPANSFFYLLTGLHGLHIVGGLIAWAKVLLAARYLNTAQLAARVELCATYWHYLLGVWLVLFALLTSSPQTFRSFASLCGF
ncbi:MAG: cytochrome C oxidase subunit III [Gammaproteobacteria bacterium]|nr:cytochrome C oxidase subunit III [Gammaproteobacteria bacterium]